MTAPTIDTEKLLLDEIIRQNQVNASLIAAMSTLLESVLHRDINFEVDYCLICDRVSRDAQPIYHTRDCTVPRAEAALEEARQEPAVTA